MDRGIVADVIAEVRHGRGIEGREPDGINAQRVRQVVHPADDPGQVADAIARAVLKAAGIDLVDHPPLPPQRLAPPLCHTLPPHLGPSRLPIVLLMPSPGPALSRSADPRARLLVARTPASAIDRSRSLRLAPALLPSTAMRPA